VPIQKITVEMNIKFFGMTNEPGRHAGFWCCDESRLEAYEFDPVSRR
jgi:hypothetical protein